MILFGLALAAGVMLLFYIIFITTENNRLAGTNKRLTKELSVERRRNEWLVEPLATIAQQEPLTALKMLREHLENNK